jgi:hypothetical protein
MPAGTFLGAMSGTYQVGKLNEFVSSMLNNYCNNVSSILCALSGVANVNLNMTMDQLENLVTSGPVKARTGLDVQLTYTFNAFKIIYNKYMVFNDRSTILDNYVITCLAIVSAPVGRMHMAGSEFVLPLRWGLEDQGFPAVAQAPGNAAMIWTRDSGSPAGLEDTSLIRYGVASWNGAAPGNTRRLIQIDLNNLGDHRIVWFKVKINLLANHQVRTAAPAIVNWVAGALPAASLNLTINMFDPNIQNIPYKSYGPVNIARTNNVSFEVEARRGTMFIVLEADNGNVNYTSDQLIRMEISKVTALDVRMPDIDLGRLDEEFEELYSFESPRTRDTKNLLVEGMYTWVGNLVQAARPAAFQGNQLQANIHRLNGGTFSALGYFADMLDRGDHVWPFARLALLNLLVQCAPRILAIRLRNY